MSSRKERRVGTYKPQRFGTLKEAVAALVEAAGGQAAAAELLGVSRSQVQRYTDPAEPGVSMPLHHIAGLEAAAGQPLVTEALAYRAERLLFLLPESDLLKAGGLGVDLAALGREASDVFARGAEFLADGQLDAREAPELLREIAEMLTAGGHLYARCAAAIESGAAAGPKAPVLPLKKPA